MKADGKGLSVVTSLPILKLGSLSEKWHLFGYILEIGGQLD
jgi:hypothetical protein